MWWHHQGWACGKSCVCLHLEHFQSVTLVPTCSSPSGATEGLWSAMGMKPRHKAGDPRGVLEHPLTGPSSTINPGTQICKPQKRGENLFLYLLYSESEHPGFVGPFCVCPSPPPGGLRRSMKISSEQCPPAARATHRQEGSKLEPERASQERCLLCQKAKSGRRAFTHRGPLPQASAGMQGRVTSPGSVLETLARL